MTTSHAFDTAAAGDHCPFMPVFGPPQVMFVRGQRHRAVGRRRQALPRLPLRSRGDVARPLATPSITEAICRPGGDAAARQQLLRQRRGDRRPRSTLRALLREATGDDGQVFFCNSGAEANEAALKLARKFGGRGRHVVVSAYGSFHGRTLAALAATGQPAKHEPFFPMPDGFRHVAYGDLDALEAVDRPDRRRGAASRRCRARAASCPPTPDYLRGIRTLCDERGMLMMVDEVQTGFARTGRLVRVPARRRACPTSSRWRRRWATASRSARRGRATRSLRRSDPATTAARTAAPRSPRRSSARSSPRCAASTRRRSLREQGRVPARRRSRDVDGRAVRARAGSAARRRARRTGATRRTCTRALLDDGLVTNAVTPTALRLAPPLTVSDAEIDEAVAMIAKALA